MARVERLKIGNKLDVSESMGLPIGSITRVGDMIYTYGMIAADPETGKIVEGDVKVQARRVLDNLKIVLEKAGSSFDDVVMVQIWLADIQRDFDAFNEVYREYFPEDPPTRFVVGATLAWPELLVEMQMTAVRSQS